MKRLRNRLAASAIFLAAFDFPAHAAASQDAAALVRKFERAYRSARTLQATFLERYLENGKEVRSEAGVAYFARPGKMRWEYESPEQNLFLIDGKWTWFYVPADHTVTRVRIKESSDWKTPLALLTGEMKVSRVCRSVKFAASVQPVNHGGVVLSCLPRGEKADRENDATPDLPGSSTSAHEVFFELNPLTGELLRILAVDAGGVQVDFHFANWRFNPSLQESKFHFAPPAGVAIVNGDLASRNGARSE